MPSCKQPIDHIVNGKHKSVIASIEPNDLCCRNERRPRDEERRFERSPAPSPEPKGREGEEMKGKKGKR